ncbi:hypothetical protein quinque_005791 [Culex quinquefasciatus]
MLADAAPADSSKPPPDLISLLLIVVVAIFWGATNPFIRRGTLGVNSLQAETRLGQIWLELKFLLSRWQYLLPLALNQAGSVVYVFALQRSELSLVVPAANSLTFVFTAITARMLGEQGGSWKTYTGMGLVIAGTILCSIEKVM